MSTQSTERARAVLQGPTGQPTAEYAAYLQHQQAYRAARQRYDDAFTAAQSNPAALQNWPIAGRTYQQAVDAAYDSWVATGYKVVVERALADLAASTPDPAPATPATPAAPDEAAPPTSPYGCD